MSSRSRQGGFSLLEVLVTTVILAFGLLGMAGLQGLSLRNNNNAYMRTQANLLAYEIVDSMRANRDAAIANDYNLGLAASAPTGSSLAQEDLAAWLSHLEIKLPGGDGAVSCDANDVCTVTVQWTEISSANVSQQFMLSTQI